MNKKKVVAGILVLGLVIGIAFNTGTTARYIKEFDSATQTISTATFQVETVNALGNHENFKPGQSIQDDKITLKNGNDYAVEFIITLNNTPENDLWKFLKLKVEEAAVENDETTGGEVAIDGEGTNSEIVFDNNVYTMRLDAGESKQVFSKILWKDGDIDADEATGKTLEIVYDITAKQVIEKVAEGEANDSI